MDLTTLERAAETVLAPPNLVSADDRKQAEIFFENFKKNVTVGDCIVLLQQSKNSFVLFQIGQTIGEIVLRDWALISQNDVELAYKTMLQFVATSSGIEPFVVGAFLKSAAMIVKRGILDKKSGDQEELYQFIHQMLTNESSSLQAAGCLFISALIEQFSSAWRNSKFSITWDFHLQAKHEFENNGLRRLLEMSLTTLHALGNYDDILGNDFARRLCDRFLEVSENILSWNFSSRVFRRFLAINQASNSFRPPLSWKDLLDNNEFFTLFFKLHAKIRHDEELCTKSMNCLIQLASLTGDCMPVSEQEASTQYVGMYITNLLQLFGQGPSHNETNHFCTIINRLFLYRPLTSIMRLDNDLRTKFFAFLKDYTVHLTRKAMQKAIGKAEHDDHVSLALIYDSIVVLLRGRWRTCIGSEEEADRIENELIKWPVLMIVNEFIMSVLSPPQGFRPECREEDDENEDNEDRTLFIDLLNPLGSMICYSIPEYLEMMKVNLRNSLNEFTTMVASRHTTQVDSRRLSMWHEDQHWLMLVLGNSVVGEEVDGSCHVSADIFINTHHMYEAGRQFCPQRKMQFLQLCMEAPTQDRTAFDNDVDPFVLLMGELFSWAAIEHELFAARASDMISPELCRSTFYSLKRFLNAASSAAEFEKWKDYQNMPTTTLPLIPDEEEFSKIVVRFVVRKVLTVLVHYGSEERLCQDAIDCLLGLIESRAATIASSPELFEYLNNLDISRLPNRTNLMKALVLIGAAANNAELQENMFQSILIPLSEQFQQASEIESRADVDSKIVDYLQCFIGVTKACEQHSAAVLFRFLFRIVNQCVPLMRTRSHNETVVSTILVFLQHVTTKVSIFLENDDDTNMLYAQLLQVIDLYRTDQVQRFKTMSGDDEDKGADLVLFMDILSNVLSKDFLVLSEESCSTGAKMCMTSLEMLLTIMNETVLQMPEVALKFFRLILYLVEFSPEALGEMSEDLMSSLCQCIKLAMTGQFGIEITSTSLEALTEVVLHFAKVENKQKCTISLAALFKEMVPTVFETCLGNTAETGIYSEACSALYSIIVFEKPFFTEYIGELLSKKSNEAARQILQQAFEALLEDPPSPASRRGRILFRQKMEVFVNKIQGLLSYQ